MYCADCKKEVDDFDNYCKYCGQLIHVTRRYVQRWKNNELAGETTDDFAQLKDSMVLKYRGKRIEDVFDGKQVNTDMGSCYLIEASQSISINKLDKNKAAESLLSDLKLIYGIGEVTEKKLKSQGYDSIEKLTAHPRYRKEAKQFLDYLKNIDQQKLMEWICRWVSKSHPHIFCLSSLNQTKDFLILDIETLGLSNRPIILIGLAKIDKGIITIRQYLARNYDEEAALLVCLKDNITSKSAFITFNGTMFDIPFINQRYHYYRIQPDLERVHFDVLNFSRNMLRERFDSFKLSSLEKNLLQVRREIDIPGFMVPEFYIHYINKKNVGTLVPLIYHNRQDLVSLASIFSRLHTEWEKF